MKYSVAELKAHLTKALRAAEQGEVVETTLD